MNHKTGRLIGVSLGPGDPELITRQAWSLLKKPGHWTYPVKNSKSPSYALDIVMRAGLSLPATYTPLLFPMTHDAEKLAKHWFQAARTVLDILNRGEDVLFLVEGDASTYSTFGHLSRTVQSLNDAVQIEIIPGVASFNAAAAQLQTPLADADDTIAVIPAGYGLEMIDRLLQDFDTLVLLKVKPQLEDILSLLEQRQLIQHCRFIEKAGCPDERIVTDVSELRGETVNYLSLLLVRNPDRVRGKMARGCKKKTIKKTTQPPASIQEVTL